MKTITELEELLEVKKCNSAWSKGIKNYAFELINNVKENDKNYIFTGSKKDNEEMLNGAENWSQYSYGGCSYIYDSDIAKRLCTPSELKKKKNGELKPNNHEEWLDTQARALFQAAELILKLSRGDF